VGCDPDPKSEEIVCEILGSIEKRNIYDRPEKNAKTVLAHALAWKRPDLWNRAIRYCEPALETVKTATGEALEVFGLEPIKSSCVASYFSHAWRLIVRDRLIFLVQQNPELRVRFSVIQSIVDQTGSSNLGESFADDALSTSTAFYREDVPTVLGILNRASYRVRPL
jgi:hypothetical protein